MSNMNVIEFYSGTQELAKTFRARGHEVITLDIDPKTNPDMCMDILKLNAKEFKGWADVCWFSPDCRDWSVAAIGKHWTGGKNAYIPKTPRVYQSWLCTVKNLKIIADIEPKLWFIENPRGVMGKVWPMNILEHTKHYITQCQFGRREMKPTNIWTNSRTFVARSCKNGFPCHVAAPRGSFSGTQGSGRTCSERLTPGLCQYIVDVCEVEV